MTRNRYRCNVRARPPDTLLNRLQGYAANFEENRRTSRFPRRVVREPTQAQLGEGVAGVDWNFRRRGAPQRTLMCMPTKRRMPR